MIREHLLKEMRKLEEIIGKMKEEITVRCNEIKVPKMKFYTTSMKLN